MSNENNGSFFSGLLTGALIGGAAALLLTPFKGKETRERLEKKAKTWRKTLNEALEEVTENMEEEPKELINSVKNIGKVIENKSSQVKEEAADLIANVKAAVEERTGIPQESSKPRKKPRYFRGVKS